MKRARVRITDHALLRYMQRVQGLDIEALRSALERRVSATYLDGACGVTIEGFSFRIGQDGYGAVVTTVLDKATGLPRCQRSERDE
ncbi:MAG: hypothetical protein JXR75_13650 [Rhodobacteraceae bacterium]|nr:hypothetical protein [Paracoccaceae bacterium]